MKATFWFLALTLTGLLVVVAPAGCQTVRPVKRERLLQPVPLPTEQSARGQVLFMRYCHTCHPDGDSGLGPALYATPMPVTRAQIRLGAGGMPRFPEDVLPDEDVDAVLAYLDTLRDHVKR